MVSIWVYPRACGGTPPPGSPQTMKRGLSPRLRGNQLRLTRSDERLGSIPAPAGEPQRRRRKKPWRRVYPRACGGTISSTPTSPTGCGLSPRLRGNQPLGRLTSRRDGLSPRLRGNLVSVEPLTGVEGSIPAPAGEPGLRRFQRGRERVYPRACGGTLGPRHAFRFNAGLSPRLRGNPGKQRTSWKKTGSIPAPAGETVSSIRSVGSIPAPAGEPEPGPVNQTGRRSILAPAVEPLALVSFALFVGVYPRACGGTQRVQKRSIPAPAGEPTPGRSGTLRFRVYPRACGGTGSSL